MSQSLNVLRLPVTSTSLTPDQALHNAINAELSDVIVTGYDSDGELVVYSSKLTRAEALFMLVKACRWAEGYINEES